MVKLGRTLLSSLGALGLVALTGCHTDMWRQNRVAPLAQSSFWQNGMGSRPIPAHTVAHVEDASMLKTGNSFFTGMVSTPAGPRLVKTIPAMAMTEKFYPNTATDTERRLAMLKRGQERFNIFCSPCHGRLGDGNGMIAMRGLSLRRKPATYHSARMRRMPDGHFYNVITNGFGVMYPYASRIEPQDRWAIVAYIRALQLSQNATPADVPAGTNLDRPATGSEGGANSPGGEEAAR